MTKHVVTIEITITDCELGPVGVGDAIEEQLSGSDFGRAMWKLGTYADYRVTQVTTTHERA